MRTSVTGPGAAKDDLDVGNRAKRKKTIRTSRGGMLYLVCMAVVGVVITVSCIIKKPAHGKRRSAGFYGHQSEYC
jgi:hypothetical protein